MIMIITVGEPITRRVARNEDRLRAARAKPIGARSKNREVEGRVVVVVVMIHGYGGSGEKGANTEVWG